MLINDLTPLQEILADLAPQGQTALIPALHAVQKQYSYIPAEAAAEVARLLGVPLAEVHGVIEFYSLFTRQPTGRTVLRVCTDPACAIAGAEGVLHAACHKLGLQPGQLSPDGAFSIEHAPCLGLCEHAPAALWGEQPIGHLTPQSIPAVITGDLSESGLPQPYGVVPGPLRLLTANCGRERTTWLEEYEASGGYQALRKALLTTPASLVAEVKESGLMGRGGAAFPTGVKWEGAAQASGSPKYVICNADESEPGTFKDRILLEEDPHRTLEGLIITGYAIGAAKGYIYIRGEYPRAYKIMGQALREAQQAGLLGSNILHSGFDFEIELRQGAGAYICGEETALFESIEGKRGFPRMKPPFPTTHGLFGQPTVINNVETLCNIPLIISKGAANFRQYGTARSTGPKLLCLSGDVSRPGLYEVPFGVTLRYVIEQLAGGIPGGRQLGAILLGGAAGVFAVEKHLDIPLTFEDLRPAGLTLGSGVVMVFDERRDMRQVLAQLGRFFAEESCGKCYPCQMGTQRQLEILQRLAEGSPQMGDLERLSDVGWTMTDSSLCGLGQTAGSAVLSAIQLWPELFAADPTLGNRP